MVPKDISWLSPKRRRTTGNLKTVSNGQAVAVDATPGSPGPRTPGAERPPPSTPTRPFSQPAQSAYLLPTAASLSGGGDGNLFYAYARRGNDLQSRYLLTFASASTANEWWTLLQNNFTDVSRPSPQLFSFIDPPDLLSQAWKSPAFAHLKSKWMYISFSESGANGYGLGGAAQGIIPVQDAQGNMLGGSAPASPETVEKVMKRETKSARNDIGKMEEHFERMMEAVERNTAQVAQLSQRQHESQGSGEVLAERNGYFDQSELSSHLTRVNELLEKHSENMEGLASRQAETDAKLRSALQDVASRHQNDYLDMSQLSTHLDRIQSLMERTLAERKDSASEALEQQARPQIDFSPLTEKLGKVQEAVEQNSALIKDLLEDAKDETKDTSSPPPQSVDLAHYFEGLQRAIEQQSSHMQALVSFASGDGDDGSADSATSGPAPIIRRGSDTAEKALAPLGEHLEQIFNAIEQGNTLAKESGKLDLGPLLQKMDAMREATEKERAINLEPLLEKMEAMKQATEKGSSVDMSPLVEKMEATRAAVEASSSKAVDLTPLVEKMEATRAAVEAGGNKTDIKQLVVKIEAMIVAIDAGNSKPVDLTPLVEKMEATRVAVEASGSRKTDLTPLVKKMEATREAIVQSRQTPDFEPLVGKFDDLSHHLQAIGNASDRHNEHLERLIDAQHDLQAAVKDGRQTLDFEPLTDKFDGLGGHLEGMRSSTEGHHETLRELLEVQHGLKQVIVDSRQAPPDFEPLTEHLQTIGAASQQHNAHLWQLLKAQQELKSAVIDSKQAPVDFEPLVEHLRTIGAASDVHNEHLQQLLQAQNDLKDAVTDNKQAPPDYSPLAEKLEGLKEYLGGIRSASHQQNDRLQELLQAHNGLRDAVVESRQSPVDYQPLAKNLDKLRDAVIESKQAPVDFQPLTERLDGLAEHLESLREWAEFDSEQLKELVESQKAAQGQSAAIAPLTEHLQAIRAAIEQNSRHTRTLVKAHQQPTPPSTEIDLTPLTERLNRIHESLQQQRDRSPGTGDAKFIMSALTSHLSKIQAVTEYNAQHVKSIQSRHNNTSSALQDSVIGTSDAVSALAQYATSHQQRTDDRVEGLNGQVRELMAGHREMVDVMRELAKSITAQNKGSCDHIVVPPPRKVGRKIVGFVYDVKDGPVTAGRMGKGEGDFWKGL